MAPPRLAAVERWFLRAGVFLLPLAYWWDTYDRYVLPKLLVARVLVIGLVIFFLARVIATGSLTIRRTPLDLPLLAFVLSAVLSTGFAYNQNVAVFGTYARYDGLLTILTYAGLFWLTVQTLAGPGDARALFRVLLASGYLVAAIAILQSVTDSIGQGGIVPAFGTLGQQNVLGAFLALLCPLAFRELLQSDTWSKRVVALNLLAVLGAGLILTLSRSAWLGTAVAVLVLIVASPRLILRPRAVAALIVLVVLVTAGLSLAGRLPLEPQIQARAMTVFDVSAWGPRPAIWRDSIRLIESRPLFGYGPDNVGLVYPRFQATNLGRSQVDKAHAESLQVAATQGLVGLAAYALVLAAFVHAFWKGRRREGAVAIFAAWVAYQVTLQLNFSALAASLPFWIFAAAAMESWGATRTAHSITLGRERSMAGAIAIAALAALALVATVFPYLADSHLRVAVTADIEGRSDLARGAAAQARDLAPREGVYAVEVGNIAFERTDWASAAQAYGDAAQLGTYNPLVYRNLALADLNLGRFTQARAAAAKAVELDRFDPANRALLAQFGAGP
ncbi:MAG TPA: O-antigen ligase family protein [Candidatus Dormibacteraeota bacterium]|nr:O-antigen ligase family protein [Candidatus Dormibacteraeota bacterium]